MKVKRKRHKKTKQGRWVGFSSHTAAGDCRKVCMSTVMGTQDVLSCAFQPRPVHRFD